MKKAKTAGTFQKTLGHLINVCKYPKVGCSEKGTRHLSVVSSDRKEAADTRTKEILLNIKKYFFTMRVTKHWHRFLRDSGVSLPAELQNLSELHPGETDVDGRPA